MSPTCGKQGLPVRAGSEEVKLETKQITHFPIFAFNVLHFSQSRAVASSASFRRTSDVD